MFNKILCVPGLIILLIISTYSFGQTDYQDVVYLKNGSIIRGMIIEQIPNKSIKIETSDRNVFVYQLEEVEKITKEPSVGSRTNQSDDNYRGVIEAGFAFGIGKYESNFIKLHFINALKITPGFSLGIGTGLHFYLKKGFVNQEAVYIPFFVDIRGQFVNTSPSPYMALGLGYTLNASEDFRGVGFLLNPSFGVMIPTGKSHLNISLAYQMQRVKSIQFNYNNYPYYYVQEVNRGNSSLSLNIGFTF